MNSNDETLAGDARDQDTLAGDVASEPTGPSRSQAGGARGGQLGRGELVGRYVILAKLGAGGMGVVYAAYDPELDRKVALKMLLTELDRGPTADGRARLLREAQALAKFSHPEIVAIHDVGEHPSGVWLAMEFVDGHTLGDWAAREPRSWRAILDVMLAAGRGVAAAHAAGLIHRDLKPDNIMVGLDGWVRVMDFGLTRLDADAHADAKLGSELAPVEPDATPHHDLLVSPMTRQGSLLGTPAYMSPEQFAGESVTPAADQFSFCVTLWELLYGERPFAGRSMMELATAVLDGQRRPIPSGRGVPSWLRKRCERGLTRAPAERWPSMQALLDELARGQVRIRRRLALAGVLGLAGVAASVAGWARYDHVQRVAACEAEAAAITEVWDEAARGRVRAGIRATKVSHAESTAAKLMPWLDAQHEALAEALATACTNATVERRWDAGTLARSRWCLTDCRLELASLVDMLAHADAEIAERAVVAVVRLEPVATCVDEGVLATMPEPPADESRAAIDEVQAELALAGARLVGGKYADGLAVIEPARARAETLGWPPLTAAALQLEGALLQQLGSYPESELASRRAWLEAAKSSAWGVALAAALNLAYCVGNEQGRPGEGRVWLDQAEVALVFAGDPLELQAASRLMLTGTLLEGETRYAEAEPYHARALAIWEAGLGPDHPNVAFALTNLGNVRARLGAEDESLAMHERALAILERAYGADHPEVATSYANLGNAYVDRAEFARGLEYYEKALAIWEPALGPEHPMVAMLYDSVGNVHANQLEFDQARTWHRRARTIFAAALPPEHPYLPINLGNLAIAEFALDPSAALITLEQAIALYGGDGFQQGEAAARFLLARALLATGGDRTRALEQAELARDGFREAGEVKAAQLADVEAWLAGQG